MLICIPQGTDKIEALKRIAIAREQARYAQAQNFEKDAQDKQEEVTRLRNELDKLRGKWEDQEERVRTLEGETEKLREQLRQRDGQLSEISGS